MGFPLIYGKELSDSLLNLNVPNKIFWGTTKKCENKNLS